MFEAIKQVTTDIECKFEARNFGQILINKCYDEAARIIEYHQKA